MTHTTDIDPPRAPGKSRIRGVVPVTVVVVFALAFGAILGASWTSLRHDLGGWHTASGHVGTRKISIAYDGWTYGATGSVGAWIDSRGSWHDQGWPDCLQVAAGSTVRVRFAAHRVTVDGTSWRPIVAIDCRGEVTAAR